MTTGTSTKPKTTPRKLKTGYSEGSIDVLREATRSKPGKYRARIGRPGKDQTSRTFEAVNDTAAKAEVHA